jgi:hypothetical protein
VTSEFSDQAKIITCFGLEPVLYACLFFRGQRGILKKTSKDKFKNIILFKR